MENSLKNKRILIFLRSFDVGGAEKQAVMLANYLFREKKAKVAVWAYSKQGPVLKLLDPKIPWKSISFDSKTHLPESKQERIRNLKNLALKILFFRPHVILPFTIGPNGDCGCIWRWTLAKSCIWNQRDEWLDFLENPDKKIERYGFANTPVFISNSKTGKEIILKNLKKLGRVGKPVFYVPNAINLDPPQLNREKWREKIGIGEKAVAITMIGNLHQDKGHETLLKAWGILLKKTMNPFNIFLLLAGRRDNKYLKLKKLSQELGIQKQIRFLGYVEDIAGLLKASDVGIFISKSEGCPNAVLESMAAKLPIITSNIRATRDILGTNYPFLVDSEKPEKIADIVLGLINDRELRETVQKSNLSKIQDFFNPDVVFKEYASIIKQTIYQYQNQITPTNIFQILKWQLSRKKPNLWESL